MTDFAALRDEPVSLEVAHSDVVYAGRVWDIKSDTFDYNGEPTVRDYVAHPGAVAVVAIDDDGRVLLLQQYRHPLRARDWEVPAGLLDMDGESPSDTARRELAEEADLTAKRWSSLVSVNTSPGGSDEVVHIFLAEELTPAPETYAREAEEADIRLEWVPLDEAVRAVREGRMRNAILTIAVLAAAERRRQDHQ